MIMTRRTAQKTETKYAWAERQFSKCRNQPAGKPVGPGKNTRLVKRGSNFAIQLHDTDVVTYLPNGSVMLDSGGWRTATTKERFNIYSPGYISQREGIWYLHYVGKTYLYDDGVILSPRGAVYNGAMRRMKQAGDSPQAVKRRKQQRQQVADYAKTYIDALFAGKVPAPSNGDCWYCLMQDDSGKTLGELNGDGDHIKSHIKEKYFVPSLLVRAMEKMGASMYERAVVGGLWGINNHTMSNADDWTKRHLRSVLRKYCLLQLGLENA